MILPHNLDASVARLDIAAAMSVLARDRPIADATGRPICTVHDRQSTLPFEHALLAAGYCR